MIFACAGTPLCPLHTPANLGPSEDLLFKFWLRYVGTSPAEPSEELSEKSTLWRFCIFARWSGVDFRPQRSLRKNCGILPKAPRSIWYELQAPEPPEELLFFRKAPPEPFGRITCTIWHVGGSTHPRGGPTHPGGGPTRPRGGPTHPGGGPTLPLQPRIQVLPGYKSSPRYKWLAGPRLPE